MPFDVAFDVSFDVAVAAKALTELACSAKPLLFVEEVSGVMGCGGSLRVEVSYRGLSCEDASGLMCSKISRPCCKR